MPSRQPNLTGIDSKLLNHLARNYSPTSDASPFRHLPTSRKNPSAESMKFKNLDMFLYARGHLYVCVSTMSGCAGRRSPALHEISRGCNLEAGNYY